MKVTKSQIKRIHMLLPSEVKADKDLKQDLIFRYTKDAGKCSTTDLTMEQAKTLISDLLLNVKQPVSNEAASEDRQRKKILSICHELNWYKTGVALDWERIGDFCEKYGTLHKRHLNAYHGADLRALVTQFEKVLEHHYKSEVGRRRTDNHKKQTH